MGSLERDSGVLHPLRSLYDLVLRECDEHGDASIAAAAAEQGVTIPGGGVGVLWLQPVVVVDSESERDVCRGLVLIAGSDGKLVFLDLRSAARGESAGLPGALRRLAAARSPAEEGTTLSSKPTTILRWSEVLAADTSSSIRRWASAASDVTTAIAAGLATKAATAAAGVSKSTVSLVLQGSPLVNEATRAELARARAEHAAQLAAQGLARALMEAGYAQVKVVVNGQRSSEDQIGRAHV